MINKIFVICEGPTEEKFVKDLLQPYISILTPTIIGHAKNNGKGKGGDVTCDRILSNLKQLLYMPNSICTIFFDFYGLDEEFPGKQQAKSITCGDIKIKFDTFINGFSEKLTSDLGEYDMNRVIPYVQKYEFESLLFSDSKILAKNLYTKKDKIDKILAEFDNDPERINNSFNTKPSKRIGELYNKKINSPHHTTYYKKVKHGILIAKEIGYNKIISKCSLFSNWMNQLKNRLDY